MRGKKIIEKLQAMSGVMVFPTENHAFGHFKGELRRLIETNCDYAIAKTLEYDEHDQKFYVYVQASGIPFCSSERDPSDPTDSACVTLNKCVTIDPKAPLGPQVENIIEVQDLLQRQHGRIGTFLQLAKQGYQMRK